MPSLSFLSHKNRDLTGNSARFELNVVYLDCWRLHIRYNTYIGLIISVYNTYRVPGNYRIKLQEIIGQVKASKKVYTYDTISCLFFLPLFVCVLTTKSRNSILNQDIFMKFVITYQCILPQFMWSKTFKAILNNLLKLANINLLYLEKFLTILKIIPSLLSQAYKLFHLFNSFQQRYRT